MATFSYATPSLPFALVQAVNEIRNSYGDTVDVISKAKSVLKFGATDGLGTGSGYCTIWEVASTVANEVYVSTNIIDTISSSNAADNQVIDIEGHTISGSGTDTQFTFVKQQATLNGQNKVVLTTPLARISRAANISTTNVLGDIHVYEDTALTAGVPTDLTKSHIVIKGTSASNKQQSYKAATTFSNTDYFIVTHMHGAIEKANASTADLVLEVRTAGGVFRPKFKTALASSGTSALEFNFEPFVVVPKNADIRMVTEVTGTNVEIYGTFQGYLASVIRSD